MATEVIKKRDAYSKTFYLGNGEFQKEIYSYPIHYKDETGEWKEIDTSIEPVMTWEFTDAVVKNIYRAYFTDTTQENIHLVSFETIDENGIERWVNLKLKDAHPIDKTINNNEYTYIECYPNIDVQYLVINDRLKENIIIKSPTDKKSFTFTLKMHGLTVSQLNNGDIAILNSDTNEIISKLDKPYMIDANGVRSDGVEYVLGHDGEFETLTVVITDEQFLETSAYPVCIDPSIIIEDQTGVQMYRSDGNHNDEIFGMNMSSGVAIWYSAIYYQIIEQFKSELSSNTVILDFYLDLYCINRNGSSSYQVTFNTIERPWSHGEQPSRDSEQTFLQFPPNSVGANTWKRIDLKNALSKNFYGFTINYQRGVITHYIHFASPFHSNISIRPKLAIKWLNKPLLLFHDGTGIDGIYADEKGNVFKYLNIGLLIAGQTSTPQRVWLRNLSGFDINNLQVHVENPNIADHVEVEISLTQNPFIPEPILRFNGTYADGEDVSFYVRVKSNEFAMTGGYFNILAKAEPA